MAEDSPFILDVQQKIDGVQRQIDAVQSQLLNEKDPEERKYLQKEVERLGKRKERLREEELLLLKSKDPAITEERVWTVLDGFMTALQRKRNTVAYPKEDAFRVEYPVCKVRLPQAPSDDRPRLLWHALDQPYKGSSYIINETNLAKPTLTVLFNASGSGKTRTLYEIAVAQGALFFVGVPESGMGAEGSGDLRAVSEKLAELYPQGQIPTSKAAVCLKALLISRFRLLRHMEQEGYVSKAALLFKQVTFGLLQDVCGSDPLMALTVKLLDLIRSPRDLNDAGTAFETVLDELRKDWNGPIIFDECQVINSWLSNRFLSSTGSSRSFLDILVPCLVEARFSRFFYAGTGSTMLTVARNISATLKARASVMVFHEFGGFYEADDMKAYAESLFKSVDSIDFPRLHKLYRGRFRFFVTAIEYFVASKRPMEEATGFFVEFFDRICTTDSLGAGISVTGSRKGRLYMDNTVRTDVRRFLERDRNVGAMQELKVILFHEIFGSSSTLVNIKDPSLQLVEYGLAWLSDKSLLELRNIDDFFSGRKERWIRLEEPAVLRALYHYFMAEPESFCRDMLISKGQGDDAKIGLEFEKLAALGAAQELDGKAPVEFVRRFLDEGNKVHSRNNTFEVPGIYFETAKLERPRSGIDIVATICMEEHDHTCYRCYTLEKYIDNVEGMVDNFPTVLLTGKAHWFGFRPDAIFFLGNNYGLKRRLIPCVLQTKSKRCVGTQGGVTDALDSTGLLSLEGKKIEDAGLEKLLTLASENGLLRLAALPHKQDLDEACFNAYKGGLPSVGRYSPNKKQKIEGVVQPLCGVIGGGGGSMFLQEWLVDTTWQMKNGLSNSRISE